MNTGELAKTNTVWEMMEDLSNKKGITDVIINGSGNIYIERNNDFIKLNAEIKREDIYKFCDDVCEYNKKKITDATPVLDGRLPDGSRINIISDSYTTGTPAITIRKYIKNIKTFETNPELFGIKDPRWIDFFKYLVKARLNVLVSGGTGVGKTTLLNLLLQELPKGDRVITIEDTRELTFNSNNVVRLESKSNYFEQTGGLSTRDLLRNTLRMRPDRIIVGEIRGGEAFDLLQAMNSGHDGSMSTLHANSTGEALIRLENLFLLSGYDIPIKALRFQISKAINFVIQISRNKDGKRIIQSVSEISGLEDQRIQFNSIGVYDEAKDQLEFSGLVPTQMSSFIRGGMKADFFNK